MQESEFEWPELPQRGIAGTKDDKATTDYTRLRQGFRLR